MNLKKIGFVYNIRNKYPDPNDPSSYLEADFDDKETISSMIEHFKKIGYDVVPIEADENAYDKLMKNKKDLLLVFNYSIGKYGRDRYSQIPSMLEMLQIPYTGGSPLSAALVLNKTKCMEIFTAREIPTPRSQVFKSEFDKLDKNLKFPLIVKPSSSGSSAGITNKSVVNNIQELKNQVKFIIETFKEPALVQTFLEGKEFTIGIIGNPPQVLPIIEVDYSCVPENYQKIDSLEIKWILEDSDKDFFSKHFICPAKISPKFENKLKGICLNVWDALELADYCRIDIRCDKKGNPYVLDVNSPAGLIPPDVSESSYLPICARTAGIDYDNLLKIIIDSARKRYKI